jgi:hypothetical protein
VEFIVGSENRRQQVKKGGLPCTTTLTHFKLWLVYGIWGDIILKCFVSDLLNAKHIY